MNGEDLRTMFGDGVCSNRDVDPCVPTAEAAAWAQMVNQSRQSGHCEGMVVQAVNRFVTKASPLTRELSNTAETTHGIIRAFATQFFPKVKDESTKWTKRSLNDILFELQNSFAEKNVTYTMGLYSDMGGHAVLPISIEYPTTSTAIVHVYDTNWPGLDRYVLFDLEAQTWEFSFSGKDPADDPNLWTGGKGSIDLASMESRLTTDAPFNTGENGVLGNFLVIRSVAPDWSIATASGNISPTATTKDSSVQPLRSAGSQNIHEYLVQTTSAVITLNLPSASSVYVIAPSKIVSIITNGSSDKIVLTQNSVVFPDSAEVSVAAENLAATVQGGGATISIESTSLTVDVPSLPQPVVINEITPQITVSITSGSTTTRTGSNITKPFPTLPTSLLPPDTKNGLPPQDVRTLSATNTSTTSTAASPTSTVVNTTLVTTTTSVSQDTIVALQYQGSTYTWVNNQSIPTLTFRFINASNQWASAASGTCTITLLPELDNGSLGGAQLNGATTATANGNGACSFSGLSISGTPQTKYRLRASVQSTTATTTLGPQTLN